MVKVIGVCGVFGDDGGVVGVDAGVGGSDGDAPGARGMLEGGSGSAETVFKICQHLAANNELSADGRNRLRTRFRAI